MQCIFEHMPLYMEGSGECGLCNTSTSNGIANNGYFTNPTIPEVHVIPVFTFTGTTGRDKFLQSMNYRFTDTRSRSCQNISLLTSELRQFRDTVFLLAIRTEEDSVFGSGDVNTTRITVQGLPRE